MPIYNPPVQISSEIDINYDGGNARSVGITLTVTEIDGGEA